MVHHQEMINPPMRIFVEKYVKPGAGVRGAQKFMGKLIPAIRRQGIEVDFEGRSCNVALCTQSWKQHKNINMPRVIRVDGAWPKRKKLNIKYTRRIRNSDVIIWQSEFCRRYASKIFGLPSAGHVVYNGDDPHLYVGNPNFGAKKRVLVCANWLNLHGDLRKIKRLHDVLAVAQAYTAKHREVEFWIAGDTGNVVLHHPNITFLGAMKHHELARYIVRANCSLDLEWFGWCPNAVVECLVAGTPVISLNNSGAAELVERGWGEVLKIEAEPSVRDYFNDKVPVIKYDPIFHALDRWVGCAEKRPAKKLFIDNSAKGYISVMTQAVKEYSKKGALIK